MLRLIRIITAIFLVVGLQACGRSPQVSGGGSAAKSCDDSALTAPEFDHYGGWTGVSSHATGRFRTEKINGRWWFITPEGHGLWVNGPAHILMANPDKNGDDAYRTNVLQLYGSEEGWLQHTNQRMNDLGINSIGGWGVPGLWQNRRPAAVNAEFYESAPEVPGWPAGFLNKKPHDYFVSSWPSAVAAVAASNDAVQYCLKNPWCIGVYTDNELPRNASINSVGTFLDAYMSLPAKAAGKEALQKFLKDRYAGDLAAFNSAWAQSLQKWDDLQQLSKLQDYPYTDPITDEAYLQLESPTRRADRLGFDAFVAARYASVIHDVLRELDPKMLILGAREFSIFVSPEQVAAMGPYVDVFSVNNYDYDITGRSALVGLAGSKRFGYLFGDNPYDDMTTIEQLTGKPSMVTEFFWRVPRPESVLVGAPSAGILGPPLFPIVLNRQQQADKFSYYQSRMIANPAVVGSTWYQWVDQPANGRQPYAHDNPLLAENQLIGIVDEADNLNQPIADHMRDLNHQMYSLRCGKIAPPTASVDDSVNSLPTQLIGSLWELAAMLGY